MKKFSKILAVLMAAGMGCTIATACNNAGESDGDATKITVMNVAGGVGREWLDNAIVRFKEKVKDEPYEEGKTGVTFEVAYEGDTQVSAMKTSGYNIYFDSSNQTGLSLSQGKYVLDISDIVTEDIDVRDGENISIEDKLDENYADIMLKGTDKAYYALPHFALYGGLTYDQDLFDANGYYFAAPDGEQTKPVETYESDFGTAKFIGRKEDGYGEGKKSCGNDGKYGTSDDGMPTSLVELLILCDKLDYESCPPLTFAGWSGSYGYYLESGLWAALAGPEEMEAIYSGKGEITVVTGFTDENLFDGIDYIKKPTTQVVTLDDSKKNLANNSVYRYYSIAYQEIAYREDWFSDYSWQPECTNIDAMKHFMYSGKYGRPNMGMFIEGDYWYNESRDNNVPQEYQKVTKDNDRKMAWMPLPTSLADSASENNGRKYCMLNTANGLAFINANIDKPGNEGLIRACKDFLQFCYTDNELSHFSGLTGVMKSALNYNLNSEHIADLNYFSKSVLELRISENTVGVNSPLVSWVNSAIYRPYLERNYGCSIQAFNMNKEANAQNIFKSRANDLK